VRLDTAVGLWRRACAFAIDLCVVAAFGRLLGAFYFDSLAALGQHGLALGVAALLAYFGLLASRPAGGATLGKRALSLRVVDDAGHYLDPGVAVARAAVLVVPWAVVQLSAPPGLIATLHAWLAWSAVVLLVWSLYLYLFNVPTRRSLPDLAVGSTVVRAAPSSAHASRGRRPLWRGHYLAAALGIAMALIGWTTLPDPAMDDGDGDSIDRVRAALQEEFGTVRVGTHLGYALSWHFADGTDPSPTARTAVSRYVTVTVGLVDEPDSFDRVIDRVATILLVEFPAAFDRGGIEITVLYGYDIGIAEKWIGQSIGLEPEEWRERIGARSIPA